MDARMRLRSHLVALVLASLVPLLAFSAFVIRENDRLQLAATERGMRETSQAIATTVDEVVLSAISALEALAESDHLDAPDFAKFGEYSRRVTRAHGWTNVFLFDLRGQALTTASEGGGAPPRARQPRELARARDTRKPVVSDLFDGSYHHNIIGVYVPVVRNGAVRFVLGAGITAASFGDVLRAQSFGRHAVATIYDRRDVIVASSKGEPTVIGQPAANPFPLREGWMRGDFGEAREVYAAFATAPRSGWLVALTTPVEVVQGPLRRILWQILTGAALAAALAGGLAFVVGRRIADAMGSLVRIARALERGEAAAPLRTGVTEVNTVAEQLRGAAELVRQREYEAARREKEARAIGEVAHALNASPDLDAILRTALGAARRLVEAASSRIALVDEAGRLVLRYSSVVSTAMAPGFVIERGRGLGGLALARAQPVRSEDIAADPRFRDDPYLHLAQADGIMACIAVPIMSAGVVVGVMYANRVTREPFTAADEQALVTLADHVAVALQKARLLAGEHAARAEAEAASRGKDELLAMLGHELRNPLSAIASATYILESPEASPDATRLARDIIGRQNRHLAHLVDDLLDVARVTSGKIVLSRRPLELAETVRRAVAALATAGRTERHQVAVDLEPVWADVDETRLEQIVTNLVGNAVKFTPPGGAIDVTLRVEGGDAVLAVRDTGVGIAPEMLPRVFEMFVQVERGPRAGAGGLGLGLTLVRRIAELHGGRVEAACEGMGRGSVFSVRLPAIARPPGAAAATRASGDGAGRRILVIEDNVDARVMLRGMLEMKRHEVYEATEGLAGLEAALRLRPDVAVIDIGLPGMDGYEVARRIRATVGAAMRLIALTGYGQPEDRRQALEVGFDAHLVKPATPATLFDAIHGATAERA
jgi:signal transduction histidine kinase/ActR/RegA family two-component response regulator